MSYRITADEVRNKLLTMVEAEIPDSTLNSVSYIPMSEAWLDTVLSDNSLAYSSLSASKQVLAKAAQVAMCAYTVLQYAPKERFQGGLTEFKGVDPAQLKDAKDGLLKECERLLSLCGATMDIVGGSSTGGSDYKRDAEDLTNIDFSDTTGDLSYSRFG